MRTFALFCSFSLLVLGGACDNATKSDAKVADAKSQTEVGKDGVKAPGVEVGKDGVKAPGGEVSADGVKAGEADIAINKDGSVKVTDGKSDAVLDAKANTVEAGGAKIDGDKDEITAGDAKVDKGGVQARRCESRQGRCVRPAVRKSGPGGVQGPRALKVGPRGNSIWAKGPRGWWWPVVVVWPCPQRLFSNGG